MEKTIIILPVCVDISFLLIFSVLECANFSSNLSISSLYVELYWDRASLHALSIFIFWKFTWDRLLIVHLNMSSSLFASSFTILNFEIVSFQYSITWELLFADFSISEIALLILLMPDSMHHKRPGLLVTSLACLLRYSVA